ncbi:hypothetical protein OG474_41095 [Kribbella sp. NBC_01505]|uniref:hypothetical protein n=1 Tax=Kribbella sp. NBC_01505 TaxID=2903580 RepID=UPI00386B0017
MTPRSFALAAGQVDLSGRKTAILLVDGQPAYTYRGDGHSPAEVRCFDACAADWQPAVTKGPALELSGLDSARVTSTVRADGYLQLTYDGRPLYFPKRPRPVRSDDEWAVARI